MSQETLDMPAVARGASRGFTVLVIGGVLQLPVALVSPVLAGVWIVVVFVVGFAAAAWEAGAGASPVVQGSAAAMGAHLLIVPLMLMTSMPLTWYQFAGTSLTAVVVGGLGGWAHSRRAHTSSTQGKD